MQSLECLDDEVKALFKRSELFEFAIKHELNASFGQNVMTELKCNPLNLIFK